MGARTKSAAGATVTFWGAARSVTGSMHQVDACGRSLLFDCGLHHGSRAEGLARNRTFPFRPKTIDAVLLSHAHVDHCGNLPNLVKQGFTGPIYCTPATRALAGVILGDSAKIQQEDAAWLNARRKRGEPKVEPLYTGRDVFRTLLRLEAVPYDTPFTVAPGLKATLVDAGHLLGSAMLNLRMDAPGGERRLTYTGDLGRPGLPILRTPAPIPSADLLISESTYGGRVHDLVDETAEQLGEVVGRAVGRGGKLLIPAFSVGRTQTILYLLHEFARTGRLPSVPVYVDSPLAVRATEVFHAHSECFAEPARCLFKQYPDLFGLMGNRQIQYIEKVHESVALNREPGPCIIISAGGMCEAGRVLYHLQRIVGDRRSTILVSGYQAEGTLGRRIMNRVSRVRILGRSCPLRAEVVVMPGLSSHPDHDGLLRHLQPLADEVEKVRLVHGEPQAADALADSLRAAGFADTAAPVRGDTETI